MEVIGSGEGVEFTEHKRTGLAQVLDRIVQHEGAFSEYTNPSTLDDGTRVIPTEIKDAVVMEFLHFMYENGLVLQFDWASWDAGRDFFLSTDPEKYERIDQEFALRLITAVIRNDRFCTGVLCDTFETGEMQAIVARLLDT